MKAGTRPQPSTLLHRHVEQRESICTQSHLWICLQGVAMTPTSTARLSKGPSAMSTSMEQFRIGVHQMLRAMLQVNMMTFDGWWRCCRLIWLRGLSCHLVSNLLSHIPLMSSSNDRHAERNAALEKLRLHTRNVDDADPLFTPEVDRYIVKTLINTNYLCCRVSRC